MNWISKLLDNHQPMNLKEVKKEFLSNGCEELLEMKYPISIPKVKLRKPFQIS